MDESVQSGGSVSFGRLNSDEINWARNSPFGPEPETKVEEACRECPPGSVAQKKAFFEAESKKKADAKKILEKKKPNLKIVTPKATLLRKNKSMPASYKKREFFKPPPQMEDKDIDRELELLGMPSLN